jgi:membrane protein required for beta-lactamase induction
MVMEINFKELQALLIDDVAREVRETMDAAKAMHAHALKLADARIQLTKATTVEELTEIENSIEWNNYA